jgi:peptidoglycan hydrolase CwlO-like protein
MIGSILVVISAAISICLTIGIYKQSDTIAELTENARILDILKKRFVHAIYEYRKYRAWYDSERERYNRLHGEYEKTRRELSTLYANAEGMRKKLYKLIAERNELSNKIKQLESQLKEKLEEKI